MPIYEEEEDWRFRSRCGNDPMIQWELSQRRDRFHDFINESTVAWAKRYCAKCPVRTNCLNFALSLQKNESIQYHPRGLWAGTTPKERGHMLTYQVKVRAKAEELLRLMTG